ncbi:proliferation-associated protein 2G4 [Octopus bimaculoides]|uniref:proliferation-associated protein 2G4 n=1 Tax=Octopus bimaculoides TaxID=37653 RepID=UPI0022E1B615|nr:proliferation-associated protein 2G4 [Octopus bimaculoides]
MADKEDTENSPAQDLVVTKYKMVGDMVNGILKLVIGECKAGKSVIQICKFGDELLLEETSKVFKKDKEMKKGLAFPTCISVNNCVFFRAISISDHNKSTSMLLVVECYSDLGAHVDGFIAVVAHTLVIGSSVEKKVKGRKADVCLAAHLASEAALRLVKPGNINYTVTDAIQKVAESFKCKPVEGMLSHQLKKHVIDGEKAIILNPTDAQRKDHEKCEFEVHDVYAIDILVSTGEGKGKEVDTRTTIYKKKDAIYQLKMRVSRRKFLFLNSMLEIISRWWIARIIGTLDKMSYSIYFDWGCVRPCASLTLYLSNWLLLLYFRLFEDEKKAKMGLMECVKHELMQPYNVLYEKEGEFVAQFKFTIILMPNGPLKITNPPFDSSIYESEHSVTDEKLKALLASSAERKCVKKKKKKADRMMAENADAIQKCEGKVH